LLLKYKPTGNAVFDLEIVSIMLANDIREIATKNLADFEHIEEIQLFKFGE
jgi:hypothetical protein